MKLISIQPNSPYFAWQLGVQLTNLSELGFFSSNYSYNIMVGLRDSEVLHPDFIELSSIFNINITTLPDTRDELQYIPSIRSHILSKFFDEVPSKENYLLIESDIIFRELPTTKSFKKKNVVYYGDCDSYLNTSYIDSKGYFLLPGMCGIIGLHPLESRKLDGSYGGAQYYLPTGLTSSFWAKVESDANRLYRYMEDSKVFGKENFTDPSNYTPIQSWCADMWSICWNFKLKGYQLEIHPQLNFCWPTDPIARWDQFSILHNAGVTNDNAGTLFYKGGYPILPKGLDLSYVLDSFCSRKYADYVEKYLKLK